MIYQFHQYLFESSFQQCIEDEGTFGRWVEKKVMNDDYLKSIISPFLTRFESDIRTANAVDMLSDFDKKQIYTMITKSCERKFESAEAQVQGGKLVFRSFLKALTSMTTNLSKTAHKNCILYYETPSMSDDLVVGAFSRFKSLFTLFSSINNTESKCYFCIDTNLNLVYGISNISGEIILGSYKLTKSSFEWTKQISSPSISGLKRDLMELSWEDMLLLIKIAKFMSEYPLGEKGKYEITFNDGVLSFVYFGISKWDNGQIDTGEYTNIKTNLKTRLSSESWSKRILLNVNADNFYLRINYKLK